MSRIKAARPKIAIIIPARVDGTRFPGKVLMEFFGVPMIEHIRRRAELNKYSVEVFVATGDASIADVMSKYGGKVIKTDRDHENGTSRCAEASEQLDCDFVIIVQGDELLILPRHIDLLIERINENPDLVFYNAIAPLKKLDELNDLSIVKCVVDKNKRVLFMYRKSPTTKINNTQLKSQWKVLGLFAIERNLLQQISSFPSTAFYVSESIEQLKLIENGVEVISVLQDTSYPSLNITEDIEEIYKNIDESIEQREILKSIAINA